MKLEAILKKVGKFQDELNAYYTETENQEVPDIETTIIGAGGIISYDIYLRRGVTHVKRTETMRDDKFVDDYSLSNPWDVNELLEQIAYDRRRVKKGWRVWRSENPDAELEKDEVEVEA